MLESHGSSSMATSRRASLALFDPGVKIKSHVAGIAMGMVKEGGKVIRGIIEQTGVKIDVHDDGRVNIFASDGDSAKRAMQMIRDIAAVAEVGKTYLGTVVRIAEFGAFVKIFPGTGGLPHISEVSENRIKQVRDELNEGDQILVDVLALDGNKIKLSRRAILKAQKEKRKAGAAKQAPNPFSYALKPASTPRI
jgi:polyribonucleotide nucleotidyltransferase